MTAVSVRSGSGGRRDRTTAYTTQPSTTPATPTRTGGATLANTIVDAAAKASTGTAHSTAYSRGGIRASSGGVGAGPLGVSSVTTRPSGVPDRDDPSAATRPNDIS
ncbi:MAG: hypothetical protein U0871_23480 [Gemmataceae bacterium]